MDAIISQKGQSFTKVADKPILSGILTGQVAGLIMAVVIMFVFSVFFGTSPLYPVQVIGSMLFGEAALPNFNLGAVLAGLVLHQFGPTLLWGFAFGLLAKRFSIQTPGKALAWGLGLGVFSMVGPYVLIPTLMYAFHGVDIWNREVPILWDWAAHLVFGASFVIYPAIARRLD